MPKPPSRAPMRTLPFRAVARRRARGSTSRRRLGAAVAATLAAAVCLTTGPAAAATAAAGSYMYSQHDHPTAPVHWLDCKPIEYRINTAGMPEGMTRVVKRVFSIIHEQTGGTFRYGGTTTHRFESSMHSATRPTIYLAFTRKHRAAGTYFSQPGTLGVGGPRWSARAGITGTGKRWSLTTLTYGEVLLYAPAHLKRYGGGNSWQALILHEVGHALDLAHRSSTRDVMYPLMRADGPGRFSPTEVKRLRAVLQRTGCDYGHLRYLSPRPGGGSYSTPSAPTHVSAAAASSTSATMRWSRPTSTGGAPIIGYWVARGGSGRGDGDWTGYVPASARSFTFTKLLPHSGYYLVVRPINALGYGGGMQALVHLPSAG